MGRSSRRGRIAATRRLGRETRTPGTRATAQARRPPARRPPRRPSDERRQMTNASRPYHDPRLRKLLLFGAILAFAWALFAALTGGIDTRIAGIVVRARGASRPLLIGFALLVA